MCVCVPSCRLSLYIYKRTYIFTGEPSHSNKVCACVCVLCSTQSVLSDKAKRSWLVHSIVYPIIAQNSLQKHSGERASFSYKPIYFIFYFPFCSLMRWSTCARAYVCVWVYLSIWKTNVKSKVKCTMEPLLQAWNRRE